ncbi:MAG: hypothetical protein IT450_02920 [Phycisphaerales bacterium]|nr:hypothetical protein [Phycisphaerales bacterium]
MIQIRLILAAALALLCLMGGCPTDTPGDGNSNSAVNENGATDNTNGSATNENANGDDGSGGNSNTNEAANENSNSGSGANENANSSSNTNDNGDSTGASIAGAWSGTLACERTQALGGGSPGTPTTSSKALSITFGSDNKPTSIVVQGYSSVPDQTVALKNVGDSVTNNVSASGYSGTMQMTIASVDYRSDRCEIVVNIALQMTASANPNATQNGTGQQTIIARTTSATALEYSADCEYQVRLQSGPIQFDTTENKVCTGTLSK